MTKPGEDLAFRVGRVIAVFEEYTEDGPMAEWVRTWVRTLLSPLAEPGSLSEAEPHISGFMQAWRSTFCRLRATCPKANQSAKHVLRQIQVMRLLIAGSDCSAETGTQLLSALDAVQMSVNQMARDNEALRTQLREAWATQVWDERAGRDVLAP